MCMPTGGKDAGDHPPITPVNNVNLGTMGDDQWKYIYIYIYI